MQFMVLKRIFSLYNTGFTTAVERVALLHGFQVLQFEHGNIEILGIEIFYTF